MKGADAVVLGVSSAGVRWATKQLAPHLAPNLPVAMDLEGERWQRGAGGGHRMAVDETDGRRGAG